MVIHRTIDLDRFEMAVQGWLLRSNISNIFINIFALFLLAFEYERDLNAPQLQPFYDSSLPHIAHPEVKEWGNDLLEERSRTFDKAPSSKQ